MSTVVMNSAMMPSDGTFIRRSIPQSEFVGLLRSADRLNSSIGYPATVSMIERISGITLPLNRGLTVLNPEDTILVIKLKYRIENPSKKRDWVPQDEDYEYFIVDYRPEGYHRVHIDVIDYCPSTSVIFSLWVDGIPWPGTDESLQRIANYIWRHLGCPDLYNEYFGGLYVTFDSDDEYLKFMMDARSHEMKDAA